ncbi:putative manganese transporter [Kocuria sp. U4B]
MHGPEGVMALLATICASLADAFMSIGVYVLALSAAGTWIRLRWGSAISMHLTRRRRWGPVLGALVTVPPGCLGVLAIARLYSRDKVTYGTLLASFVATMGDSAWLLLASDPLLTLVLKVALVGIGTVVGYVVDALGAPSAARAMTALAARVPLRGRPTMSSPALLSATPRRYAVALPPLDGPAPFSARPLLLPKTIVVAHTRPETSRMRPTALMLTVVGGLGLFIAAPVTFQQKSPEDMAAPFGGLDIYTLLGVCGFALAVGVLCQAPRRGCGECTEATDSTLGSILTIGIREAAHITAWAGAAFAAWDVLSEVGLLNAGSLPLGGVIGIVMVAALGLIPACGVEVAVAGLFVAGGLPLPALVTYLVSQDGSGLIPLAVSRPHTALTTSIITTTIAATVGLTMLLAS